VREDVVQRKPIVERRRKKSKGKPQITSSLPPSQSIHAKEQEKETAQKKDTPPTLQPISPPIKREREIKAQ
jgi:hypothetical protein